MAEKLPPTQIPFKMHPRVFAALGADLVTNDVVAVIELVKNSYDAFAQNVWITFGQDDRNGRFITIKDDGFGMSRATIEDVWCTVATPFKQENPYAVLGDKQRRVSGEKGLGRLSVARLGARLSMVTKFAGQKCWELSVDWQDVTAKNNIDGCYVSCLEYSSLSPFADTETKTGTLLIITQLNSDWDESMLNELKDNLSRLISPFSQTGGFTIHFDNGNDDDSVEQISSPEFLSHPKYMIKGSSDNLGNITCTYFYNSIDGETSRETTVTHTWNQIYRSAQETDQLLLRPVRARCGSFSFEIRAWDIGADDIEEISDNFGVKKASIRKAIRVHKGLSVYRDGILVLPKSDNAKDWLGLDLRRVSKVGTRLSTSQVVGHVAISAEDNPGIADTSDRERLVSTREVKEFEVILKAVIGLLENQRDTDRIKQTKEKPLESLFEELSAEELLAEVISIAEEGGPASEAVPLLRAFNRSVDQVRKTIQDRFIYYSRLATIGTIAQMLVHEIRNRTTIFGAFLKLYKSTYKPIPEDLQEIYEAADKAIDTLERLADTFAPLANRSFKRRKRDSNLKEQIEGCLALHQKDISKLKISAKVSKTTDIRIAVDPGELDAVLLNLISNAIYWLSQVPASERQLVFKGYAISNGARIRISVDDSGPGISEEDKDKVMWPGVTRKPGGIGMGLTVAGEVVSEYEGQLSIKYPGTLGGASFIFDLPIKH